MSDHSSLVGGSSADRYINCLGAAQLGKSVPVPMVGAAAHLGTALHYVMEALLKPEATAVPRDLIGDVVELDETDAGGNPVKIELTEALVLMKIQPAIDWFEQVLKPDQYWLEERVEFKGELEGAFGTADVLYIKDGTAGVVDWKFGGHRVSAKNNAQLQFYLAAALQSEWFYDMTVKEGLMHFEAHIVQPSFQYRAGNAKAMEDIANRARYSFEDLCLFHASLRWAKKMKDEGNHTLSCGRWCQFCRAQPVCPAWSQRGSDAIASLKKVPVEGAVFKSGAKKGETKPVSPAVQSKATLALEAEDTIRERYLEATALSGWCEAVKKYVADRFAAGAPIKGLKRVVHREVRMWKDEEKARLWAKAKGLGASEYNTPRALISVAKMEALLGEGTLKESLVQKAPRGIAVVRENDPRPSVDGFESSSSSALSDALNKT